MTDYNCEHCLKSFSKKSQYNKHMNQNTCCDGKDLNAKSVSGENDIIPDKTDSLILDFEKMKVSELKNYCKKNGIKGIIGLKKLDIIDVISNNKISLNPIVKWSGGKSDEIKKFIKYIPKTYDTYLEPFIGGGAVYFHINPLKSVISDVHTELIDLYQSIKNGNSSDIYDFMKSHPNEEEIYYEVRSHKPLTQLENGQRFYYLRKTCFRGMLRYNGKGEFNIPYGRYKNYNFEDIINPEYEKILGRTCILNKDFKYIFENYNSENNFMFLDPPYDSEFTDYGYCIFGKKQHQELATCFKETKIKCLMIIGKTDFIVELYKDYIVDEYDKNYRFKLYSGRVGNEINTKHLIIMNY